MNGYQVKKLLTILKNIGSNLPLMPKRYKDIAKEDKKNHDFCKFYINSSKEIILAAMNMYPNVMKEVEERFKY